MLVTRVKGSSQSHVFVELSEGSVWQGNFPHGFNTLLSELLRQGSMEGREGLPVCETRGGEREWERAGDSC